MDIDQLKQYLEERRVPENTTKRLKDNNIDGSVFLKMTRSDLLDLFPENFIMRKTLWDLSEDQRQEEFGKTSSEFETTKGTDAEQVEIVSPSPPSIRRSITSISKSVSSSTYSEESSNSSSQVPPLKSTHHFRVDKAGNNEDAFSFPISQDIKKCELQKVCPPKNVRTAFIRDCYTCLLAAYGPNPSDEQYRNVAKEICNQVTVLRDIKPPAWPKDKEFTEWDTVYYSLKKRGYAKKPKFSNKSDVTDASETECAKHYDAMRKELLKMKPNKDAIKIMLAHTFQLRQKRIKTNDLRSREVVPQLTKEFPFLKNELVLLFELELHVKEVTGEENISYESFINNWDNLAEKIVIDKDFQSEDLVPQQALEDFNKHFQAPSFVLYCEASEHKDFQEYLKDQVDSNAPRLVIYESDVDEEQQIFLVVDKCIFLELKTDSAGRAIVIILALHYAFNLLYESSLSNMYRFLEEYVLKIPVKSRPTKYRRIVNSLMR